MTEIAITSRDNPLFKRLKKLAESARARREAQMTLLDGEHLLAAYLDAGGQPHTLVRADSFDAGRFENWAARCPDVKAIALPDALFDELAPVSTPTGLLSEAAWLSPIARDDTPLIIVLEDIQDPGNLGSILRSAAAAGCDAVYLSPGCADAWSPRVLRAGMGGHFVLSITESTDLLHVAGQFSGKLLAASLQADRSLYACNLRGKFGFAIGNEGAGLSPALLQAAQQHFIIPMPGRVESLNAAAATAVCLFEAVRQRQ